MLEEAHYATTTPSRRGNRQTLRTLPIPRFQNTRSVWTISSASRTARGETGRFLNA